MICFLLNDETIQTDAPPGIVLLDYIRGTARLTGTKIGCREGDCGACTVLVGEPTARGIRYRNVNSCLMPLGNAAGKHVVTVEGLRLDEPNLVQAAFVEEGATQCGFCTPGFIVSLAGYCLDVATRDEESASDPLGPIDAIGGNICRCTGYKSIERAAARVERHLVETRTRTTRQLVDDGVVPATFLDVECRLAELPASGDDELPAKDARIPVGGGTDLYVQRPDSLPEARLRLMASRPELRTIGVDGGECTVGASVTMGELERSAELRAAFPRLREHMLLIASQPIRNQATIAGNLANASPIGDMTVFFLALDSRLVLHGPAGRREIALRDFYRGYKDIDLRSGELIESVRFAMPGPTTFFNFEKVSKRTCLDIASVNSALRCDVVDGAIRTAHCAVGGVAPVPLYLAETSRFLVGKDLSAATAIAAAEVADREIAPISDVRGSAEYKRLLCRQLLYAHLVSHPDSRVDAGALCRVEG